MRIAFALLASLAVACSSKDDAPASPGTEADAAIADTTSSTDTSVVPDDDATPDADRDSSADTDANDASSEADTIDALIEDAAVDTLIEDTLADSALDDVFDAPVDTFVPKAAACATCTPSGGCVDGYTCGSADAGTRCNPLPATVEICGGGLDEDCDGKIDCDDPECGGKSCGAGCTCGVGVMIEVNCADGLDNDGDSKKDCGDSDCNGKSCTKPGGDIGRCETGLCR